MQRTVTTIQVRAKSLTTGRTRYDRFDINPKLPHHVLKHNRYRAQQHIDSLLSTHRHEVSSCTY